MPVRHSAIIEAVESRRLFAAAVGLTSNNSLVEFDTDTPGTLTGSVAVSGLQAGESLLAIDFRPSTGQLYGLGSSSRLYTIDRDTGAATAVGGVFAVPLVGSRFSMDFNPFADALRVVSEADQDLRINVNTGAVVDANANTNGVQPDGTLAYAGGDSGAGLNPLIAAVGYSGNFSGTAATTLYGIDSERDVLVTQGSPSGAPVSPNSGTLLTVGALGVDATSRASLDVASSSRGNEAILVTGASSANTSPFYRIDLTTGRATFIGNSGARRSIVGLAIAPPQTNVLALSSSNRLIQFNASNPNASASSIRVRLPQGETLLAIDFQPRTNRLIGLSDDEQLYVINPINGRVSAFESSIDETTDIDLQGTRFSLDFNPAANAIRIVSNTGQNLRVNATTGALVMADTAIAPASGQTFTAAPVIGAVAYNNNVDLTPSTTLYGIDTANSQLVTQGSPDANPTSPNTGQLFAVGPLGFNVGSASLDIGTGGGVSRGLAILTPSNGQARAGLYDVNLFNGRTARIGSLPRGIYSDVAIVPDDVRLA
ncbi:MAG TPA: DUF4394 domain-containing protein [Tepidisphaeraceae bacterium]|jgi:hypothetical protein